MSCDPDELQRTRRAHWWQAFATDDRARRRAAVAMAVAGWVVIGVIDYFTGPLVSLSAFYLVPAAWATAAAGRRAGWALAGLSAASAIVADIVLQPHQHRAVAAWNVVILLGTLLAVVELVERLRLQVLAARDTERQGREFLAFAAHQLRTPISAIRSTVDAICVSDNESDDVALLDGLARESARAGRLVNSLLRVARLDQHEPLPLERVELGELARAEVDRAASAWPNVDWRLELPAGPAEAECHADSLAEALSALVDNARRHAVTAVTVSVFGDASGVGVAVHDDGSGIAPGKEEAAFGRFVSLDGQGGSGLGLPISRAIAEAHHGSLVYSAGSFVLRLPSRPPSAVGRVTTPKRPTLQAAREELPG